MKTQEIIQSLAEIKTTLKKAFDADSILEHHNILVDLQDSLNDLIKKLKEQGNE